MFNYDLLNILMIRSGIKITDLALKMKVSKKTISDWIHGKADPRIDRIPDLARIFKVDQSEFIKGVDNGRI